MIWEKPTTNRKDYFYNQFLKSKYRNVSKYYDHLCSKKKEKFGKKGYTLPSKKTFNNWASTDGWLDLAIAYDNYNSLINNYETIVLMNEENPRTLEGLVGIQKGLVEKTAEFIVMVESDEMSSKDAFTLTQLVSATKTIVELIRLVTGESTENIAMQGELKHSMSIDSFDELDSYCEHDNLFEDSD